MPSKSEARLAGRRLEVRMHLRDVMDGQEGAPSLAVICGAERRSVNPRIAASPMVLQSSSDHFDFPPTPEIIVAINKGATTFGGTTFGEHASGHIRAAAPVLCLTDDSGGGGTRPSCETGRFQSSSLLVSQAVDGCTVVPAKAHLSNEEWNASPASHLRRRRHGSDLTVGFARHLRANCYTDNLEFRELQYLVDTARKIFPEFIDPKPANFPSETLKL